MDTRIYIVPQHLVDAYFPLVAGHLQKAIEYTDYSEWDLQSVYRAVALREAFLFVDHPEHPKNALVGKFVRFRGHTAFALQFIGGEGGYDWCEGVKEIRKFAAQYGVMELVGWPRKGWKRLFNCKVVTEMCVIEDK